ncbi:MAG: N utilization substance protein B, partial [Brevundimonas sp.]
MSEPGDLKAVLAQLAATETVRHGGREPHLSLRERRARTVARLAAVQALYQMELAGTGVETVIREFSDYRF